MPRQQGGLWGHLFVSICACLLTVSIVGSAAYLVWRVVDRRQIRDRVEAFVASLESRTPEELAERARSLKQLPKVARHVLPEIIRTIRQSKSENRQRAAVEISKAFLDNDAIVKTLSALAADPRETIAAAAVEVLSELQPPQRAAEIVGRCLRSATTAAARDEACAALHRLGEPGRREMEKGMGGLSIGRRLWLVRYVDAAGTPNRAAWLALLKADAAEQVRTAAEAALAGRGAAEIESTATSPATGTRAAEQGVETVGVETPA
ncbi:MAG TPA: hypothetical protein VNT79_05730 [Phycisphaerae bacterium]|nr:hypothetical protein [Phycisphaerae bacterium]